MEPSPIASVSGADDQLIRELLGRAQETQNQPGPFLALHTPQVVIVNLAGRRVLGREAFAEAMAGALASPLSDVRTTVEIIDIRLALPDVAIVSCIKTIHDGRAASELSTSLPSTGALTYVLTRCGGNWQIAVAQTTPILAAPTLNE